MPSTLIPVRPPPLIPTLGMLWSPSSALRIPLAEMGVALTTDPNNTLMIENLRASFVASGANSRWDINPQGIYQTGVPLWYADAYTPTATVTPTQTWWGPAVSGVPWADWMLAATGNDKHLAVVRLDTGIIYEGFKCIRTGPGAWTADFFQTRTVTELGYYLTANQSSRAGGHAVLSGCIRYQDMKNALANGDASLPYPLAFAYGPESTLDANGFPVGNRLDKYARWSAATPWNTGSDSAKGAGTKNFDANIPNGARLTWEASVTDASLQTLANASTAPHQALVIYRTIAKHGLFCVDGSGTLSLRTVEGATEVPGGLWPLSVLRVDAIRALNPAVAPKLRVLNMGALITKV